MSEKEVYPRDVVWISTPDGPIKIPVLGCANNGRHRVYECEKCGLETEDPNWDDDGEDDFPVCPKCGRVMSWHTVKENEVEE